MRLLLCSSLIWIWIWRLQVKKFYRFTNINFINLTFVARYCFLVWLIHRSWGKSQFSQVNLRSISLILSKVWNFNAIEIANVIVIAIAKSNFSIIAIANINLIENTNNSFSHYCLECMILKNSYVFLFDHYETIIDKIVISYITK